MGIKSTKTLTREQAESLYFDMQQVLNAYRLSMSDSELEDALEDMNDQIYRRDYGSYTGFYNYLIREED